MLASCHRFAHATAPAFHYFAPLFDHAGAVVGPCLSRGSGKTIEPKTRIKRCDDESTKRLSAVRTRGSQKAGHRSRGVEFAPDSSLERDGFEPSVPGTKEPYFVAEGEFAGTERGQPKKVVSYAVPMVRIHLPPAGSPLRTWRSPTDQPWRRGERFSPTRFSLTGAHSIRGIHRKGPCAAPPSEKRHTLSIARSASKGTGRLSSPG
jgi:hypothetical protein